MDGSPSNKPRSNRSAVFAALLAATAMSWRTVPANAESIDLMLAPSVTTPRVGDPFSVEVYASMPTPLLGFGFDLLAGDALQYQRFEVSNAFVGTRSRDTSTFPG